MDEIYKIEELFEELAEEVEPYLPLTPKFLSNSGNTNKPLSLFSVTTLFIKVESIRIGIFELGKIEEYYSLNILFRSLIEHFVKAQYIWIKTLKQTNDEIGIDYLLFGANQEHVDYAKCLTQAYKLNGIAVNKSPTEILKEIGILSGKNSATQIRKRTNQFKYKNMSYVIAELTKSTPEEKVPLLGSLFPRYSELSSCVHGGPNSISCYKSGPEDILDIINMSALISLHTRWCTNILCYQYEKDFGPLCNITKKYIKKLMT